MKKLFLLVIPLSILLQQSIAQTYNIATQNGQTISTCSGTFYDSGGSGNSYGNNQNHTITFCSNSTTNTQVMLYFNSFDIDYSDTLYIHDGPNTSSPLIVSGNTISNFFNNANSLFLFPVQSTTSGCLTLNFKSNGSSTGTGWDATISCTSVCQTVIATLDTTNTTPLIVDSNYIDVCKGDTVFFAGKGIYPQNGVVYNQYDSTSTFIWDFGDGTVDTGQFVSHVYDTIRGYDVMLTVIDTMGCISTNAISIRVRMSASPIGAINPLPDICANTSLTITSGYSSNSTITMHEISHYQSSSQRFDSTMFIPDGPNCPTLCYYTDVMFNNFLPGQTISSATDILAVCVNMEHSFVGDLDFTIICPNGQQTIMKTYINSGGAWMGDPLDGPPWDSNTFPCDPTQNSVGSGWNYCWSQTYPQIGSVNAHSNQSKLDSTNTLAHTGYYTPDQNFSNLIGCPLNGTWTIRICDNWAIDNGYIFSWDLHLDPSLLPTNWGYHVDIDTVIYNGPFIDSYGSNSVSISPDSGGVYTYNVTILDEFGCSYDTVIPLTVVPDPEVDLGPDTTICGGTTLTLDPGSNPGASYNWSTGDTTQTITISSAGTYDVTVTQNNGNISCSSVDEVIVNLYPAPTIGFIPDILNGCAPLTVNFVDFTTPSITNYLWDFGDGNTSIDQNPTHTYNLPGIFSIMLDVVTIHGCTGSITIPNLIEVYAQPAADFDAVPEITNMENPTIQFVDQTTNGVNWLWDFGDGSNSSQQSPYHTYNATGTYDVWLIVSTDEGCIDSAMKKVKIIDDELIIPNVITPNGDGYNDVFHIENLEYYISNKLIIFNRWGKKIYEAENYQNNWGGGGYSDGVYYYILECHGFLRDINENGSLTIIGTE